MPVVFLISRTCAFKHREFSFRTIIDYVMDFHGIVGYAFDMAVEKGD